jgi:hypothetical protein
MSWRASLSRPVPYLKPRPGRLLTLHDARAYMIALGDRAQRQHWQHAIKLTIEAAEGRGDMDAVTQQLGLAMLLDGALDMGPPKHKAMAEGAER